MGCTGTTGQTTDLLALLTDPKTVAEFADGRVRQGTKPSGGGEFSMCEPNGHWKKAYEEFDGNMFVMTDDLRADGWLAEYLLMLCFAGQVAANDGALPCLSERQ
jgi:hypothetical protein